MNASDPVLQLRGVSKRFGNVEAVTSISFAMERGNIVALLGPSGCGKTTTLRMIAGFTEPDEGEISIGGRDMKGVRPYDRNIGLVFQDYALFPHLTVGQNVGYGLAQRGFPKEKITRKVREMLELVQLSGYEKRLPASLSGGQQQRVALARSIATSPDLMLLDEPLSALDAKLRQELRFELKRTLASVQCTALIVTHDQEEAMSLADHVVVMHAGRIVQQGPPAAIYDKPNSRLVADFVGRTNWFNGRIDGHYNGGHHFLAAEGHFSVTGIVPPANKISHLCVRPERLTILSPDADIGGYNVLDGNLAAVAHLGAEIHYLVETSSGNSVLIIEHNRDQRIPERGAVLRIGFRPGDGILIPADTTIERGS